MIIIVIVVGIFFCSAQTTSNPTLILATVHASALALNLALVIVTNILFSCLFIQVSCFCSGPIKANFKPINSKTRPGQAKYSQARPDQTRLGQASSNKTGSPIYLEALARAKPGQTRPGQF